MSVTIEGVNHFAVSVSSIEESIAWYQQVLGFALLVRDEIPGIDVKSAHMKGHGIVLELFEAKRATPLPEYRKFPNTDLKVQGNKHLSLSIADRERCKHELEALGVNIVMTADVWGTYGIFINDPTGNLIELFEGDMEKVKEGYDKHKQ